MIIVFLVRLLRFVLGREKHCTKGIMDYIHSDFWGPARVPTHGGSRYFLTMVDDYSR